MCITFLYINPGDSSIKYKLILINNRDEFYARKTLKANVKINGNYSEIYGTDVQTDVEGTWLAISKQNQNGEDVIKIGNILNVPGEIVFKKKEDLLGRGPISLNFIRTDESIEVHNRKLCDICTSYNSFNFLSVEIKSNQTKSFFTSNTEPQSVTQLEENFIGVSNSTKPFKKVISGREEFEKIINEHKDRESLIDELMKLLKCEKKYYPDEELKRRRGEIDAEHFSSIFVRLNGLYGTRTHTIILIDDANNIEYIEETMMNADVDSDWEMTRLKI